jgi:hypothetical protein
MAPLITTKFVAGINEGSVDDFASKIDVQPNAILRKGEKRPPPRPDVPFTEWILERQRVESYSINDELSILLDTLWPYREELRQWAKTHSVEYVFRSLVYVIEAERPEYILYPDVMQKMAYIGGRWDIAIQEIPEKTS